MYCVLCELVLFSVCPLLMPIISSWCVCPKQSIIEGCSLVCIEVLRIECSLVHDWVPGDFPLHSLQAHVNTECTSSTARVWSETISCHLKVAICWSCFFPSVVMIFDTGAVFTVRVFCMVQCMINSLTLTTCLFVVDRVYMRGQTVYCTLVEWWAQRVLYSG